MNSSARQRTLELIDATWTPSQLHILWKVADSIHTTDVWYGDLPIEEFRREHGSDYFDHLALTIALFEINKGLSFAPESIVICEKLRPWFTRELYDLWCHMSSRIWAQWRYENDLPGLPLPRPAHSFGAKESRPVDASSSKTLWLCGGGKDSLVTSSLLEHSGQDYDALSFTFSAYGSHDGQQKLLDPMLSASKAGSAHVVVNSDTAMAIPEACLRRSGLQGSILAGETPSTVFEAVPLALAYGYNLILAGNERSANHPNLH